MAVEIYLVQLMVFACRVIHKHHIIMLEVITGKFLVKRLRCVLLSTYNLAVRIPACPCKLRRRYSERTRQHAVYLAQHLFFCHCQLLIRSTISLHAAQTQTVFAQTQTYQGTQTVGIIARKSLSHNFGRHNTVFRQIICKPRILPPVIQRMTEQPVNHLVIHWTVGIVYHTL